MQSTKGFRDNAKGLPDLINYAALVDDGIVQGKDGCLLAGFFYRGKDISSCTEDERNYITARINAALCQFTSGWVTWHDAVRLPTGAYPDPSRSAFPDPISALIDAERRTQFTAELAHYESEYVLIVMYTPPLHSTTAVTDLLYDEDESTEKSSEAPANRILAQFKKTLTDIEDGLRDSIKLRRMRGYTVTDPQGVQHLRDELVNYLHFTLTGSLAPVNIPPSGMYLDAVLGGIELWTGDTLKLGERFVCCVALQGFPQESYPNILNILDHLIISYRWSTRFIYMDSQEAMTELKKYHRKWKQKVRGFISQIFKTKGGVVNEDALLMSQQVETAINEVNSSLVTFGYYTPVIVLMSRERDPLMERARIVVREVQKLGFSARIETLNTMDAWLGSLPGHPLPNIRRPLMHTLNLADMLPLASVWAGLEYNPCPFYPANSPPLLYAATIGATPFRLNLHVGDLGHTLIFGPTGSGKSTLLGMIAAQFRRYPKATIWAFDKGRSMWALAKACGGKHYDIASETGELAFCPLSALDSDSDMAWAEEWIATCYELQTGHPPSPRQREEIHRAMRLLQASPARSLTDYVTTVQDQELRSALAPYTIDGSLGHLLDSRKDGIQSTSFAVFEIEELLSLGTRNAIPVLLYLFRRLERSLKGQPTLLILDEAWVMLGHPVFREKIREWLKVLRKANCAVVLATQSLSDAIGSGIMDVLQESCPTKIMLPNEEANKAGTAQSPGPYDLYTSFGLNNTEINILRNATKKRHYYYASSEGRRLFDLGIGPIAISFIGASSKEQIAQMTALEKVHGDQWPYAWLKERGVQYEHLLS